MNKKLGIKVLLKKPFSVIMAGIRASEQDYFKNKTLKENRINQLPTIDILDLIPNLNETIQSYSFLQGTSLITDFILLKAMAKKNPSCSYLEIGSWRGESLVNVADITEDLTSITLSANEMRNLNFGEEFIKVHGIFSNHLENIKKVETNSHTFDFNSLNKKFDLIFVDGDHSYEGVLNDTKKVFPLRKNENSVIVWHDYGFGTEDVRYSTLKAILDGIPKEFHKNLYHVSNTMCAIYLENNAFKTNLIKSPSFPNKKFNISVRAEKI